MKFLLPLIAILLGRHAGAQEEAEAAWLKWRVRIEVTAISLPAKIAQSLLPALRDEKQIDAAWKELQKAVEQGSAKVELDASREGVGNDSVDFISGDELRYPESIGRIELIEKSPIQGAQPAPGPAVGVSFVPDQIATRLVGIKCKADPQVSDDGKRLIISVDFERTWLRQWDEFEAGRLPNNEKILFKQPRFSIVRANGSFGFDSGCRVLVSSHPVNGKPDQMEVVTLRASTTLRRDAPAK